MVFASSSPKPVIAIQTNSYCDLGFDSEQHDHNGHPLPPLQSSSFQTVHGITAASTKLLSLECRSLDSSSTSTSKVSHPNHSPNDVKSGELYPLSALSSPESPESPPLTENNFLTSVTSKNEVSSSHHSKNHGIAVLLDSLKRLNPAIILQNCGSVARDHLSSERTFLAYVHTSLCLSSAGVAIVQLLTIADFTISNYSEIPMLEVRMKRFAIPLGVVSQVLALWILFIGE